MDDMQHDSELPTIARLYFTGRGNRRYKRASVQAGPGEPLCFVSVAEYALRRRDAQIRALEAVVAALRAAPEWQPIGTAPRDGTRILLWNAERAEAVFGRWLDDGTDDCAQMTHWAPEIAGPGAAQPQGSRDVT